MCLFVVDGVCMRDQNGAHLHDVKQESNEIGVRSIKKRGPRLYAQRAHTRGHEQAHAHFTCEHYHFP